jgi:hypothetical protein
MREVTVMNDEAQRGLENLHNRPSVEAYPPVAIIVLSWNGLDDTVACLTSLRQISYPHFYVIVVDNGSTDGSPDKLARLFPEVVLLRREVNGGYAAGNNEGIRYAIDHGADLILILNNDVVAEPGFLLPMVQEALSERAPGVVTCKALFQSDTRRVYCTGGHFSKWRCSGKPLSPALTSSVCEVEYVSGCILLVRRSVFETVGLFDERFFMYCEDLEFSLRVRTRYPILYTPSGVVYHRSGGGSTWTDYTPTYLYYTTRNRFWVFRNERLWYRIYVFFYGLLNTLAKSGALIARYGLRGKPGTGTSEKLGALWRGFLHGVITK